VLLPFSFCPETLYVPYADSRTGKDANKFIKIFHSSFSGEVPGVATGLCY
jgi:hypothetical protein